MNDGVYIVVGDDYLSFANRPNVLTYSQITILLEMSDHWSGDEHIIVGQGINDEMREALKVSFQLRGLKNVSYIGVPAPLELTHKRSPSNVLITAPMKLADKLYLYEFVINDIQDRLSDHVTGQHVGAMLLMEAARQATIASIECEWIGRESNSWGLILETFNAKFDNYAFPLPTSITVNLEEGVGTGNQIPLALNIEFHQAGKRVSRMLLEVRLSRTALLGKIEKRLADQAVSAMLKMHIERPQITKDLA